MNQVLDDIDRAIKDIAEGRPVVVVDDADRENEGDIILAASMATPELLAFMIRYTSGVICVPLPGAELDRLHLPLMTSQNTEHMRTAFTLSVDARAGVTTGISAADRAATIARLVDPETTAQDLVRPGHIFPLRYAEGGVLRRPGHTEAAVDLARLAGLPPAGVLAEVVNDDGTMARLPELRTFADTHDLALISIEQLVEYRRRTERQLTREAQTRLPNAFGLWQAFGYRHEIDGTEYVALVLGDVADGTDVLTRLHSECLTGDVFGSLRCDCGAQLEAAMAAIAAEGRGVVLYLRGHEGRGVGLLSKLQAYALQDAGADTVDANLELGLPVDAREYSAGAQMLADLGVRSIRLLTNNPAKVRGLTGCGVDVTARVPLTAAVTPYNLRYLTTKRDKLGHQIQNLSDPERAVVLHPRMDGPSCFHPRMDGPWCFHPPMKRRGGGGRGERRGPARCGRGRCLGAQPGHRGHPLAPGDHRLAGGSRDGRGRRVRHPRPARGPRPRRDRTAGGGRRTDPVPRRRGLPRRGDPRRHPALRVRLRLGDRGPDPGGPRRPHPGGQRRAHL